MKRLFTLSMVAALLTTPCIYGKQLSPSEALAAAKAMKSVPMKARGVASSTTAIPVFTATDDGVNTLYVFNAPRGYVVVAADDVAMPLLGYADAGNFDPANMPADLRWWLDCYSAQIRGAVERENRGEAPIYSTSTPSRIERSAVAPITKTFWNQDAPYNNLCPELTVNGTTSRAVTGCVATAMAQVIKTHNWPATGVGSNSYTFTYEGTSYSENYDFASVNFDWANMLDQYTSQASAEENTAVATLMLSCGMAVNMSYGLASTGGSGAVSFNAAKALINHFNYDKGVQYLPREYYTSAQWNDIIYQELAAGRAVLLGGESSEGGHEFVCDGYSADNYFHINWGWGGMSNGYFLLSALDPPSQGIGGGSNDGFNMSQDAIIGIQPPVEGSAIVPAMVLQGNLVAGSSTYSEWSPIQLGAESETLFYSISTGLVSVTMGAKATDSAGNVYYLSSGQAVTIQPEQGTYYYSVATDQLGEGTYTVTPAFMDANGDWHDVKVALGCTKALTMTIGDGIINLSAESTTSAIEVVNLDFPTPIYIGSLCNFTATIEATGEFYGEVIPALVSGSSVIATAEAKGLSFTPGETQSVEWVSQFTGTDLTAGTYSLVFLNSYGRAVSQLYSVEVQAEQTVTPTMTVQSVTFPQCQGSGTADDPYIINDASNVVAKVNIEGTQGYWADNVVGQVFNTSTGRSIEQMGSEFAGVQEGQTVELSLQGDLTDLDAGSKYIFLPWGANKGQLTDNFTYFALSSTVGAEDIVTEQSAPIQYFNLQGVRIDHPKAGQLVIKRQGSTATKTVVR